LRPCRVRLARKTEIILVPHVHEFDFQAIALRELSYEAEVFSWLRDRSYDVVIEIGANVGIFTLFFANTLAHARIYAFEPSQEAYRRLILNLHLNRCDNVQAFNCAVADTSGILDFFEPHGHLTNGSLSRAFAEQFSNRVSHSKVVAIDAMSLEQLFETEAHVLIKLDIEGEEPRVLKGMQALIQRYHPDLLIEVLESSAPQLNKMDFLVDGTYQLLHLTSAGPISASRFYAGQCRDYALIRPAPSAPHIRRAQ
jgi:FkbM family methyltransferase